MGQLTIRDSAGTVIGEPNIGSAAVLWQDRIGSVRSMLDTELQKWIYSQLEAIATVGGDQEQFLDSVVSASDECSY